MLKNGYKVIDVHCHIYPEKIAAKAVAGTDKFYDTVSYGNGLVKQITEIGRKAGTDKFVIHSVATTPRQVSSVNRFIAECAAADPEHLVGFGTLYAAGDVDSDIKELMELGLNGVKMHPEIQGFRVDEPSFVYMLEKCMENGITVLLHTGDLRYDCSNPNRLYPVVKSMPDLTVIGAHFGGWSNWTEAYKKMSELPNFMTDVSSSLMYISPEEAVTAVRAYGADRVLYGTDYPMWDPETEIVRFMELPLTEDERKKILYENAERVILKK